MHSWLWLLKAEIYEEEWDDIGSAFVKAMCVYLVQWVTLEIMSLNITPEQGQPINILHIIITCVLVHVILYRFTFTVNSLYNIIVMDAGC